MVFNAYSNVVHGLGSWLINNWQVDRLNVWEDGRRACLAYGLAPDRHPFFGVQFLPASGPSKQTPLPGIIACLCPCRSCADGYSLRGPAMPANPAGWRAVET